MPIRPFLADRAFDPEVISEMSTALESVCGALRLKRIDDAATRAVAYKIIEIAQRGVRGTDKLHAQTMEAFQGE